LAQSSAGIRRGWKASATESLGYDAGVISRPDVLRAYIEPNFLTFE
jgi:hypothetical protein